MKATRDMSSRFWEKVEKGNGCWLWTGTVSPQGYGSFGVGTRAQGKKVAHRVAYELASGPIPHGMVIDHICGVRRCVCPDHLRLATTGANAEHRVSMMPTNRSGYRGVAWHKQTGKWTAQVQHRGKKYHLGMFDDPAEAARAAATKRAELYEFGDHPSIIPGAHDGRTD